MTLFNQKNLSKHKIIFRIKGGLGNQLFCYAAARRLAYVNNAELVIDDVTGFIRDSLYRRKYSLNVFNIKARLATSWERMEPFERYRRGLRKKIAIFREYSKRNYIEQKGIDFDYRILNFRITKSIYLDGLWISEKYFNDIAFLIRQDLTLKEPLDAINRNFLVKIMNTNSVALHVRWFDDPTLEPPIFNLSINYYKKAIQFINEHVSNPHFFLFSDKPDDALQILNLPNSIITKINCNQAEKDDYKDLMLMSNCKNFITANSTFSWWGAWLSDNSNKIVITPDISLRGKTAWGFNGLIPDKWIIL